MIKVMSFSSDVRTHHVFVWVPIIVFTSAVSIAVTHGAVLQIISQGVEKCGGNVTLTCEANSSKKLDIKLFSWLATNQTVCQYEHGQPDPEGLCESMAGTRYHRLSLTLLNVMPVNQGKYLCKLRTDQGVWSKTTAVTVQDCFGSYDSSINKSQAMCSFSGIYPRGTIHWFKGDVDLTDTTSTQVEEDQHGRYNVWSTIDVQKGNLSQPYNCSLWIPSAGKYASSQQLPMVGEQRFSSGSMVRLQWLCILVEIMMVKFMT